MREIMMKIKRKYFEAFADLEEEIRFLRKTNFVLAGLLFFALSGMLFLGVKPPVVIRVSEVAGAEAVWDLKKNNAPTGFEMIAFAKRFITAYTAFNSYTAERDLSDAFNRMTAHLQKEARKAVIDSGFAQKLKDANVNTEIEFKEAKVERDDDEASVLSLVGIRRITKYDDTNFHEEVLFRSDVVLRKVNRTLQTPEGLLVEAYREITLNDLKKEREKS